MMMMKKHLKNATDNSSQMQKETLSSICENLIWMLSIVTRVFPPDILFFIRSAFSIIQMIRPITMRKNYDKNYCNKNDDGKNDDGNNYDDDTNDINPR